VTKGLKRKARKAGEAATGPVPAPISLVLIEDNRLLREGIAALIHTQPGFKVLAASADVDEALKKVRESKPDVVLLDFGLQDHDSLSLTATVHGEVPAARVIVMGLLPLQEDIANYVRAGASGFIMKDATLDDLVNTIRLVAKGAQVLPPEMTRSLFSEIARNAVARGRPAAALKAVRMTPREREVINLIAEGMGNKEIATRLHIATHTVKSHVRNVMEKLTLHTRLQIAAYAHGEGRS